MLSDVMLLLLLVVVLVLCIVASTVEDDLDAPPRRGACEAELLETVEGAELLEIVEEAPTEGLQRERSAPKASARARSPIWRSRELRQ